MAEDRARSTPEKQLLKLIEDPHGTAARGAATAVARGVGALSLGALQGRFGFFKKSLSNTLEGLRGPLDVKKVNMLLTAFVIGAGVWFAVNTIFLVSRLSRVPDFEALAAKSSGANPWTSTTQLKSIAFYKEKAQMRDLFRLGGKPVASSESGGTSAEAAAKVKIQEALAKFKLVGISWSDNPDAMIENSNEQKTYFVKRDQALGDVKVEAIFKDKVVLSCQGVEVELR
jgi:hypothetical protein